MFKSKEFFADRRGNVAIVFAFVLTVLLGVAGIAMDYAVAVHRKKSMDQALDNAVLAATNAAREAKSAGKSDWKEIGKAVAISTFQANLPPKTNYQSLSFAPTVEMDGLKLFTVATYRAQSDTSLMSLFGFDRVPFDGMAKATLSASNFIDVHFVIDGSASMGIGAVLADQTTMYNETRRLFGNNYGCAFACHQKIDGAADWSPAKMRSYIKPNGRRVELRIDIIRNAIKNALALIRDKTPKEGNVRIALHLFSDKLGTILPLTSNLNSAVSAANTIDLVNGDAGGSYISHSMRTLAANLGTAGDGTSENKRASYVVLLSDGIDDSATTKLNGGSIYSIIWTRDMAKWIATSPSREVTDKSWMQPFSTVPCKTMKDKGHRVLTVQIKYILGVGLRPSPDIGKVNYVTGELAQPLINAFKTCSTNDKVDYRMAALTEDIAPVLQNIVDNVIIPDVVRLAH
jgi:hypothetical protein